MRYFISPANSLYTLWSIEEAISYITHNANGDPYYKEEPEKHHYVKNLSKDYATAIKNAKEYIANNNGVLDSICEEKELEEYSTATTGKKHRLLCESERWMQNNLEIVATYKLLENATTDAIAIENKYSDAVSPHTPRYAVTDWSIIKDSEYLDESLVNTFINAIAFQNSFGKDQWGVFTSMVGSIVVGKGKPTELQELYIKSLYHNHKANYQARLDTLKQIRKQHLDYLATCDEVPSTEERMTLVGQIQKIKIVEHQFGFTWKMILLSDSGYKLYGSIPTKLLEDFNYNKSKLEGLQISFDATVEQSERDKYFGFFKRPTKLNIINKESA